ncbi:MAG: hypothetical protein HY791_24955 [Deltaproteobacteria bacterium]|nr:hypothetical protein [Deltaproteobacteria bacterium]
MRLGISIFLILVACDPAGLGRSNPHFRVIGHRGAPAVTAENTIESFEVALALGANAIETDVCRTQDGTFVIFHDADPDSAVALARQGGAESLAFVPSAPELGSVWRRPVSQLTLEELRGHYGYAEPGSRRDTAARIPTVFEFLDWARTQPELKWVYWDLKLGTKDEASAFMEQVSSRLLSSELDHVVWIFLHIDRDVVQELKATRGRIRADALRIAWDQETPGALERSVAVGLRDVSTGLTPSHTYAGFKREVAELVEARERGELDSVTVWTFDDEMQLSELLYYSVDGVMTNEPRRLHRIWQRTVLRASPVQ